MPCIETYQKVDLRTITLGVPPQEVTYKKLSKVDEYVRELFGKSL